MNTLLINRVIEILRYKTLSQITIKNKYVNKTDQPI